MPVYRVVIKYELDVEADDEDYACERVWKDYNLPDFGEIIDCHEPH